MNILFITADQWRGDCLSSGGHPCVQTPNLDRLAADGVELSGGGKTRRLTMRPLHELPPPVPTREGKDTVAQSNKADLTQDFWKIFDSLKP